MCTSFRLQSANHENFLARTMDFAFQLEGVPIVIPKGYTWKTHLDVRETTRFGMIGTGRSLEEIVLVDGMNENGLSVAELYFPNEAKYSKTIEKDKVNLAPHELILWILGNIASVEELKTKIEMIHLVHIENSLLSAVVPLHYIVTDRTGACVVIETNKGFIEIKDNFLGVMTNSPELEWHLKNLSNYLSLKPTNFPSRTFLDYHVKSNGLGSGTAALPGGFTSPERFVRAVYFKEFIDKGLTTGETLNALFQILNNFSIPKGILLEETRESEYTQYRVAFHLADLEYYFSPYETPEIFSIKLKDALVNLEKPKIFEINKSFAVTQL